MPLDHYSLPFCAPPEGPKLDHENLGELLSGDRIESSPYYLLMKTEMYCEHLCVTYLGRPEDGKSQPNKFVKAIRKEYHSNWIVDNLPAASKSESDSHIVTRYWQGFPIGFVDEQDKKAYVNNHVNIEIMYHPVEDEEGTYRVVRFIVEPFSIAYDFDDSDVSDDVVDESYLPKKAKLTNPIDSCNPEASKKKHTSYEMIKKMGHGPQEAFGKVLFTYDVIWTENLELKWASRWDIYLSMDEYVGHQPLHLFCSHILYVHLTCHTCHFSPPAVPFRPRFTGCRLLTPWSLYLCFRP